MLRLASLLAAILVAGATATAAVVSADGDRITICHKEAGQARTLQVASSSWHGHERHGDHKGACTSSDVGSQRAGAERPLRPASPLALKAEGEGDLDGDAGFRILIDHDANAAYGVRVEGRLLGEGRWTVEPAQAPCTVAKERLTCAFGDLAPGEDQVVRLHFDGPAVSVCREAGVELRLTAANDATAGDDQAKSAVRVGACSALDP